jgi:O-antigen/teichoic acid export membrane protein
MTDAAARNLTGRILSGSVWSIGGELLANGSRALAYFFYAKFLSPTDFGVVGFSLLLTNLFPMLLDNSLGLALIRQPANDQRAFSIIFFLNVAASTVGFLLLLLLAQPAGSLIGDARIATILPVLGTQLLFNSLSNVHLAIARQRFRYSRLIPVRLISTVCSILVATPLALRGYGYWSLIAASVVGSASQAIAAWLLLPWLPSATFDWQSARRISVFAGWTALDMTVTWLLMSGGSFILALYLGTHDLGLFRLSDQLDTYVIGALLNPLIPVLYSAFCETADHGERWREVFTNSLRAASVIALMLAAVIAVSAYPLELILGPKWSGLAAVVTVNAVADGVSYAILPIPSLLRAQGRSRTVAGMRVVMVIAQLIIYPLASPHGLFAFVVAKATMELFIYLFSFAVLRRTLMPRVGALMSIQLKPAIAALLGATVTLRLSSAIAPSHPVVRLTVALLGLGICLGAYLYVFERRRILAAFRADSS